MKNIFISCVFISLSLNSACATIIELKDTHSSINKGNTMKPNQLDKIFFDLEKYPEDNLLVKDAPVGYYAIVSKKISLEGMPINFMYREEPSDELSFDSGWRVFSGTEDQEYTDNPNNFSYYSLTRLVNYQPNTSGLFWQDIGTVLEIKQGQDDFSPVNDWKIPKE